MSIFTALQILRPMDPRFVHGVSDVKTNVVFVFVGLLVVVQSVDWRIILRARLTSICSVCIQTLDMFNHICVKGVRELGWYVCQSSIFHHKTSYFGQKQMSWKHKCYNITKSFFCCTWTRSCRPQLFGHPMNRQQNIQTILVNESWSACLIQGHIHKGFLTLHIECDTIRAKPYGLCILDSTWKQLRVQIRVLLNRTTAIVMTFDDGDIKRLVYSIDAHQGFPDKTQWNGYNSYIASTGPTKEQTAMAARVIAIFNSMAEVVYSLGITLCE